MTKETANQIAVLANAAITRYGDLNNHYPHHSPIPSDQGRFAAILERDCLTQLNCQQLTKFMDTQPGLEMSIIPIDYGSLRIAFFNLPDAVTESGTETQ